ncbi:MAG: hypothetical protein ND807_07085 [Vicinamibacterales bacterium]|nr:hypothetical protein [Vicinamibacterales bacterium]
MTRITTHHTLLTAAGLLMAAGGSFAQTPGTESAGVFFERNVEFMSAPIAFDTETITGAPYSAEAVTEITQTLADGNRIVRRTTAEVARDSVGRTRREQGLAMLGPMINAPEEFRHVQITDPEAHTMIILNMKDKTAQKMPAPNVRFTTKMGVAGEPAGGTFEMALPPPAPGGANTQMIYRAEQSGPMSKPVIESLGKQFVEGVEAEGTRTTSTIPAGQVGNELPISVVSERWFSPDLKVLVMSRQSDPRFGDTTYRLTNIVRAEPSPALFEIPADFTVNEAGPERDVIIRRIVK